MSEPGTYCEVCAATAALITACQAAALDCHLEQVIDSMHAACHHLAHKLNDLNEVYAREPDLARGATAALCAAVHEVTEQATLAAIYTLAVTQRTRLAAQAN